MTRQLATTQKVISLEPIPGADKIEVATILGWHLVVLKNEFKVGELCVYCEVDSLLPIKPEFEFLRKSCYLPSWNGFRIRTIRLRGQVSQGIAFPLSILPNKKWKENDDVTDVLGIIKYDPQAREEEKLLNRRKHNAFHKFLMSFRFIRYIYKKFGGKKTSSWPGFISKTDEECVQKLGELMPKLVGKKLYYSEKLDGQSGTYAYYKRKFYVCSRNIWLSIKNDSNYWKISDKYNILSILKNEYKQNTLNLGIQGEIVGPGIQGNKYELPEIDLFVFNIYDINQQTYFNELEIELFCKKYGLKMVPVLGFFMLDNIPTTDYFVELSRGKSILDLAILREGIVIRTTADKSISFKAINPDFLEKYKE